MISVTNFLDFKVDILLDTILKIIYLETNLHINNIYNFQNNI